jgi:hypothetical protein
MNENLEKKIVKRIEQMASSEANVFNSACKSKSCVN